MSTTKYTKPTVNFGAGPAKLPMEVLQKAQAEMLNFSQTGISILEMSHRTPEFDRVINAAEATLRELLDIPNTYRVLFLQGGGNGLFAAVPLNLIGLKDTRRADYVVTGTWSTGAAKEADKYGTINRVLPKFDTFRGIPDQSTWKLDPDASYVYYCDNETIEGIEFPFIPETNGVPLVCDMSSNFLSRHFDINKFGMVFAGAQKNVGCAGVTVAIVRADLMDSSSPQTPLIWDFHRMAAQRSLINTPPVFAIYILGMVLDWIRRQGGLSEMEERNKTKAGLLYRIIDDSKGFYNCPIEPKCRSMMNVSFRIGGPTGNEKLESRFVKETLARGMIQLSGHRSVGGLRASLYNAVTIEDVLHLDQFMVEFQSSSKRERLEGSV